MEQSIENDDAAFYGDLENDMEIILEEYDFLVIAICSLCCLFALVGMFGALCFNKDMVVATALFFCLLGACTVFSFSPFSLMVFPFGFFAYPHFVLFQEIGEGIMSFENYPNERHSCCCLHTDRPRISIKEAIEQRVGVFN